MLEGCQYHFWNRKLGFWVNRIEPDKFITAIQEKKIQSLNAYADGFLIVIKERYTSPVYDIPMDTYGAFCPYTPNVIEQAFAINTDIADVINLYLGRKAQNPEQARIYFMAKILGARDD